MKMMSAMDTPIKMNIGIRLVQPLGATLARTLVNPFSSNSLNKKLLSFSSPRRPVWKLTFGSALPPSAFGSITWRVTVPVISLGPIFSSSRFE